VIATAELTKTDLAQKIQDGWVQKNFELAKLAEYAYGLPAEKAFVFARVCPKPLLEDIMKGQRGNGFCDKVLNFTDSLDKDPLKSTTQVIDVEKRYLLTCTRLIVLAEGRTVEE